MKSCERRVDSIAIFLSDFHQILQRPPPLL
uniref:Uncharacterized protein n=1 Tax=Arundo donax TaxID=35708 RepID=A0A0A9CF59_ARUDO